MYYLDTSICVEFLRGRLSSYYQVFRKAGPRLFALPAIVMAELQLGARKSNRRDAMATTDLFLSEFAIIPFDEECATAYACLRAQLEGEGRVIGPNDMLIAATAIAHQATLVTRNEREFARIAGLHIEVWEDFVDAL